MALTEEKAKEVLTGALIDGMKAVGIAEGWMEPEGETQEQKTECYIAAWQYLVDSGLAWQLQGSTGRAAMRMIRAGLLNMPETESANEKP